MLNKSLIRMLFLMHAILPAVALAQDIPTGNRWRYTRVANKLNICNDEINSMDEQHLETRCNMERPGSKP